MLVLLLGFMAVAGVVVYRLWTMSPEPGAAYGLESVSIPAGAEVVSAAVQEGFVVVTYRLDGATLVRLYDGSSGEVVREIAVVAD